MSKRTKRGLRWFGLVYTLVLGMFFAFWENRGFPSAGLMLTGLFVAWVLATLVISATTTNRMRKRA